LVPSGQTVNQHHDIEVLTKLREGVGRKWPEKRVDFAPGQRASTLNIVCEAIFS
jgi:hypothetical protein